MLVHRQTIPEEHVASLSTLLFVRYVLIPPKGLQKKKVLGVYALTLHVGYEERRSGGLQIHFDYLEIFNALRYINIRAFSSFISI